MAARGADARECGGLVWVRNKNVCFYFFINFCIILCILIMRVAHIYIQDVAPPWAVGQRVAPGARGGP